MEIQVNGENVIATRKEILSIILSSEIVTKKSSRKGKSEIPVEYINLPVSFDIEVSSFVCDGRKTACMYVWMIAVNDKVVVGRTWDEFIDLMEYIASELGLTPRKRLVIYVHNLAYEFQFIRKRFLWNKVFSLKRLRPVYALTESGIEFRCSYLLSALSLDKTAETLTKHKLEKKKGQLDYRKIRGPLTPLTMEEWEYCIYDVLIVTAYIQEKIESDGDITKIPLTNTGYVRNYCRSKCIYENGNHKILNKKYKSLIRALTLDLDEYRQLERAFQGGFTHANQRYVDRLLYGIKSEDLTSAYPSQMVMRKFPMSRGCRIDDLTASQHLDMYLNNYCCCFELEMWDVISLTDENILSKHKCIMTPTEGAKPEGEPLINNGRIIAAPYIKTTVTEVDFKYIQQFYTYEDFKISNLICYRKEYLPTEFVQAILELYKSKTELKGDPERVEEYMKSKGMLNSTYGMAVMKIIREVIEYNNDWGWMGGLKELEEEEEELERVNPDETAISKYNKNFNRFLFFPWGVWITAYTRAEIFEGILHLGKDYVYCDTDSLKFLNPEKHLKYFEERTKEIKEELRKAMEYHDLPFELCVPKTIKGEEKLLGEWDDDGTYRRFKTLGAKRYLKEERNKKGQWEITMTVAGCNKEKGVKYFTDNWEGDEVFNHFTPDVVIPPEYAGRLWPIYDEDGYGITVDYLGNEFEFHELSFVYMEDSAYTMNRSKEFRMLIEGWIINEAN